MLQFLTSPIGDSRIMQAGVLLAVVITIAITLLIVWRIIFQSRIRAAANSKPSRLAVVDVFDLDRNRQLVLVRRDQVEHLVMIGGPNDLVVEMGIVRTALPTREKERMAEKEPFVGLPLRPAVVEAPIVKAADVEPAPPAAEARMEAAISAHVKFAPDVSAGTTKATERKASEMEAKIIIPAEKPVVVNNAPEATILKQDMSLPGRRETARPAAELKAGEAQPDAPDASEKPLVRTQFISRPVPQPRTLPPMPPRARPLASPPLGFTPRSITTPKPAEQKHPQIALQPVAPPLPTHDQPVKNDVEVKVLERPMPIDELELEMARLLGRPVKLD